MDSIIPRPLFSHQLVVSFGKASFDFYHVLINADDCSIKDIIGFDDSRGLRSE